MERYDKLNLKIDSLKLRIYTVDYSSYSLINKLIVKALQMGTTELDFDIFIQDSEFTLPHEVFGSENLVRLWVGGCKIGLGADGKVSCSRLGSLTLFWVFVEGDIIWDIISSCPLNENLSLFMCKEQALSLSTQNVGLVVERPFSKLRCLLLSEIDVPTLFFNDFSSKFPCLKDLSVYHVGGYKGIKISSTSLECISFSHQKMLRVKFDVPNIRKFTFSGSNVPSLSFKTITSNWESDISIKCLRPPTAAWFLKLNRLLTNLRLSKVSLSLYMCFKKKLYYAGDIQCLTKPEVENLTIDGAYSNCADLFDGLFQCCRPIYVTQNLYQSFKFRTGVCDFMEFVYKRVMQEVSLKCCSASQSTSGECHDLEEVNVEYFDETVSAWQPRSIHASTCPGADERRIRLQLRWGR